MLFLKDDSPPTLRRRTALNLHPNDWKQKLAAADEVDDLDAVAVGEGCGGPVGAADDVAVEFDGDAPGRERELFDEGEQRRPFGQFLRLAVQLYAQAPPLSVTGG